MPGGGAPGAAAAPAAPAQAGPAAPPGPAAAPGGEAAPDSPSDGAPERGGAAAGGGGGGGAAAAGGGDDVGGRRFSLRGLFDALAVGLVMQVAGSSVDVKAVRAAPCERSQCLGARACASTAAPRFPAVRLRARDCRPVKKKGRLCQSSQRCGHAGAAAPVGMQGRGAS